MGRPSHTDEPVIDVRGLVKSFGRQRALDGLDLRVERGEVHGFLGPNGAGKSTTLRVLLGLARRDAGEVRILGHDPWNDARLVHGRIAYVPGDVTLWPNLTGGEVLDLLARLQGSNDLDRRNEYLERFALDPTKRCRAYSRGNRQKVALIAALCTDAEVYLLDEPTAGLDPLKAAVFADYVRALRERGATVLLSSHILSEADALSDRVTIIRDGRAVISGRLDELRHLTRTEVTAEVGVIPSGLELIDGVHDVTIEANRITAQVDPRGLDALMSMLADAGLRSLQASPPTLEEMFLRAYRSTAGDHGEPT